MKKVWIVTEFVDGSQYENSNLPKGMKLPVSCEIFSKEKLAFDFANRDSLAFRTITEKIVDKYIKIEEY